MKFLSGIILFFIFSISLHSQNFFPTQLGNKYEYKESASYSPTVYKKYLMNKDTIFEGKVFYRFMNKYFHYDSLESKLYILTHEGVKLAADFKFPADSSIDLYIDNSKYNYISRGSYYDNVFGKNVLCYKMQYSYSNNDPRFLYQEGIEYIFADSIGIYYRNSFNYSYDNSGSFYRHELSSAQVDSVQYSIFSFDINLISDIEDTPINYFPIKIRAGTSVSDFNFVDTIYADFYVYRNDTLVCQKQYPFSGIILTAYVDLDSTILKVGDLIKFRCILKDSTVLENSYFSPDSGYYSFRVLTPVMTGIKNTNQSTEFSFGAFPNPFNSSTKISFQLLRQNAVNIEIYNILGKKVRTIINNKLLPGKYSYIWDSQNDAGEMLPSGIYFVRFNSDVLSKTLKIVLLK